MVGLPVVPLALPLAAVVVVDRQATGRQRALAASAAYTKRMASDTTDTPGSTSAAGAKPVAVAGLELRQRAKMAVLVFRRLSPALLLATAAVPVVAETAALGKRLVLDLMVALMGQRPAATTRRLTVAVAAVALAWAAPAAMAVPVL